MKGLKSLIAALGFVTALPVFAEMAPPPAPVGQAQLIELTATVEDVDLENRLLTVKGPKGGKVTTEVGPEVKNLAQVKVGDEISVKYYRAMLTSAVKVGGEETERSAHVEDVAVATAALGEKPAGIAGREVTETIKILVVDPYKKAIAFRGMDGRYREVSMDAPHLEHYLDDFKEGDAVKVSYREALAITVDPAQ